MEEKDYTKLRKFVEAALTNPRHPVYQVGMSHSAALQHYATNVTLLQAIQPEQWFKDYPLYTAQLEEVMKICETPDSAPVTEAGMMVKCPKCGAEFGAQGNMAPAKGD